MASEEQCTLHDGMFGFLEGDDIWHAGRSLELLILGFRERLKCLNFVRLNLERLIAAIEGCDMDEDGVGSAVDLIENTLAIFKKNDVMVEWSRLLYRHPRFPRATHSRASLD